MEWLTDWLFNWFYEILYTLQKSICVILDFIVEIFRKLAGIETVTIDGKQEDLLSHFLLSNGIKTAFLGVLLVGVVLLTIFTIIAVLRSETADGQHKKSKGQILTKSGQAFIIFLVIPFLLLAGIVLANAIMTAIDQSMTVAATGGIGRSTVGGQILVTSGSGAFKGSASERAYIEQCFINGTLDYNSLSTVKKYYDLSEMNFFVGIGSGLVILVMFVISVVMFVQRIFDIILLYVVSPVSTATIPIDDGGRFRIWREMLISKILGAYGIILSMNIFFLIVPQVNSIKFFPNSFQNGIVALLFVIGGAFSVTKANMVIAQLTGNNAGAQEAQQMMSNIHTGMRMGRFVGATAGAVGGRILGGGDFIKNKKKGAGFGENVAASVKSKRNQREVSGEKGAQTKGAKTAQGFAGITRLATAPIGMVKDFAQGGLITMGKNFIPRMRNVFTGNTITSRADVRKKPEKTKDGGTDNGTKPKGGNGGTTGGSGTVQQTAQTKTGGSGGTGGVSNQQAQTAGMAATTGGASAAAGAGSTTSAVSSGAGSTGTNTAGANSSTSAASSGAGSTGTNTAGADSSTSASSSSAGASDTGNTVQQAAQGTDEPPSDWVTPSGTDSETSSTPKATSADMGDVVRQTAERHAETFSETVTENMDTKGDDKK